MGRVYDIRDASGQNVSTITRNGAVITGVHKVEFVEIVHEEPGAGEADVHFYITDEKGEFRSTYDDKPWSGIARMWVKIVPKETVRDAPRFRIGLAPIAV